MCLRVISYCRMRRARISQNEPMQASTSRTPLRSQDKTSRRLHPKEGLARGEARSKSPTRRPEETGAGCSCTASKASVVESSLECTVGTRESQETSCGSVVRYLLRQGGFGHFQIAKAGRETRARTRRGNVGPPNRGLRPKRRDEDACMCLGTGVVPLAPKT